MSALEFTKEMLYASEAAYNWPIFLDGIEYEVDNLLQDHEQLKENFSNYINGRVNEKIMLYLKDLEIEEYERLLETPKESRTWHCYYGSLNRSMQEHGADLEKTFPHFARVSKPFKLRLNSRKPGKTSVEYYTSAHHAFFAESQFVMWGFEAIADMIKENADTSSPDMESIFRFLSGAKCHFPRVNLSQARSQLEYERLRAIAEYGYPRGYDPEEVETYSKPDLGLPFRVNLFHSASTEVPSRYIDEYGPIGPLIGNGKNLAKAILNAKDNRPLRNWNASGAGFIREISKQKLEVYFQTRSKYESAKERLAKLEST